MAIARIKDPAKVAAGRKAMAARWGRASQADKDGSATNMREGLTRKYTDQARTQVAALGLTASEEQIAAAATSLHRAALREAGLKGAEAVAQARVAKRQREDADWVLRNVRAYANILTAHEPTIPERVATRLVAAVVADELDLREDDAGLNRARCIRRLDIYVERSKAHGDEQSRASFAAIPDNGEMDGVS